ncbi:MAG: hypothetical protein RR646_08140 [Erysipelotrichaceae bacterium]
MKKVFCLFASLLICATIGVSVKAAELSPEAKAIYEELKSGVMVDGKMVNLPAAELNAAENYLKTENLGITVADKDKIVLQIKAAKQLIVDNKVTDIMTIDKKIQDQIIVIAQDAGNVLGLTISPNYADKKISVTDKSGKLIFQTEKAIKNTGDDYTITLVISATIALILAGAGIIAVKNGLIVKE